MESLSIDKMLKLLQYKQLIGQKSLKRTSLCHSQTRVEILVHIQLHESPSNSSMYTKSIRFLFSIRLK